MGAFLDGVKLVLSKVGWNDIIDILIVTYILFKLFCFIRDSRSQLLFKGILIFLAAWLVALMLNLQMVSYLVDFIIRNAGLALVIVFSPEIRDVLERLGRSKLTFSSLLRRGDDALLMRSETLSTISNVVECARVLKKQCMGALVVFERRVNLNNIIATGTAVDIAPNVKVLSNIFYNKAPLHDGAVVIRENRICAASCILPLTQRTDIDPDMGTRHRAAIGMSEQSDAVVVVVSEETGRLSVMCGGEIKSFYDPAELSSVLMAQLLPPEPVVEKGTDNSFFGHASSFFKGKPAPQKAKTDKNASDTDDNSTQEGTEGE